MISVNVKNNKNNYKFIWKCQLLCLPLCDIIDKPFKFKTMDNQQQNPNSFNEIITKYVNGESMNKLSQEYDINIGNLRYKLSRAGIYIRNIKEGLQIALVKKPIVISSELNSLIIGMLLGDGSLRITPNGITPHLLYSDKHKEVHEYLIPYFLNAGIRCSEISQNTSSGIYQFQTETRSEFLDLYNLFYPKNIMIQQKQFRKILPNIELNPINLLWWYLGDGSSSKVNKTYNHRGQIACKHFNPYIMEQLKSLFGNQCTYYIHKTGGTYYLGNVGLILLLEYIGICPIKCYNYKWITRCSETIMEES